MPVTPAHGQRVGSYVLSSKIAAGAFGEVWLANHHAWPEKLVAVKIPTDLQYVRNLQKDGAAMHGLRHPCIVEAVDFDPYGDPPYLAMEYVAGSSLRPLIQGKKLNVPESLAILRQVLAGLGHAHFKGIIHRDIKPENILVNERAFAEGFTTEGLVKVTDFGLGQVGASSESMQMSSSASGERGQRLVGTVAYMAPEVLDGEPGDARADLYACGVILFELLTGRKPHGADLPGLVNSVVPFHVDAAFRKAYALLGERFASADEFLAALNPPQVHPSPLPAE
jgi:serine/threonine-protein kinase